MATMLQEAKLRTKAADKAARKNRPQVDEIDKLDMIGIGPAYHHDGPYEATLASRNRDRKTAPVEAVKHGNMAALQATPYEHVQDSLRKHVPLQGTAVVPPGDTDMFGRTMNYDEGDDLMRETDSPGGPYKRYDHLDYSPEDLKGKGEPSFTIERDLKAREANQPRHHKHARFLSADHDRRRAGSSNVYEMRPMTGRSGHGYEDAATADKTTPAVRQRSVSSAAAEGPSHGGFGTSTSVTAGNANEYDGAHRTAKPFDGLKRRFGSLRQHR